jgi:prepilin-type N-terminal cleavage/methylation domain-containing protein
MDPDRAAGFTLIEVSLAVLVIGLGLLAIFSLFPAGLRSAEEGAADTHAGLFADTVMNGLHGNAATLTNWTDWCNSFSNDVVTGVLGATPLIVGGGDHVVSFPEGGDVPARLRYRLTISNAVDLSYSASLEVCDGEFGSFRNPSVYYTEFFYKGM